MSRRRALGIAALALVVLAAGCGGGSSGADDGTLAGAGSSLVAPLVARWAATYAKRPGATVTYSAIGSGGGIAQVTAHTVDFGASDAPLSADQQAAARDVVQIPWALAATLVAVNVPGVEGRLRLTGPVLADIYLGRITSWDDPALRALNPSAALPRLRIAPLYRNDASGDTYAFTDYLTRVSPAWRAKVGASTEVSWPTGSGARGNAGVLASLGRTKGAIAYAAVAQVKSAGAGYALLRNAGGRYPEPTPASIAAAGATALPRADHTASIVDPPASAPDAYPLATFTYVLVPTGSRKLDALKRFLRYAVGPGQAFARALSLAPLPASVRRADLRVIAGL